MTHKTKIGLLVGLAFIIVIGILLSDHLTSSTEPPQASLAIAGNGVRQAIGTPGGAGVAAPVTVVTPSVSPQDTVATQAELTKAPPAVQIVRIGGPTYVPPAPVKIEAKAPAGDETAQAPPIDNTAIKAPATESPDDNTAAQTALAKVAAEHGETLVALNSKSKSAGKTYTAQPGDSVSKIASKLLGSSSKANIDAFLKANPSMGGDPTKLLAGKAYTIPATGAVDETPAAPPAAIATGSDADDVVRTASESKSTKSAADTIYTYTVKPGDNLTKIARDQLGDMHAVASIQELNGDKLKGTKHDVVMVGMKLKLPGKPVAKAD